MIELKNLTKKYGDFQAVDNLNLSVRKGEVFGFIGPNGAGKTTTIKMMGGILGPTAGTVTIAGVTNRVQPKGRDAADNLKTSSVGPVLVKVWV